MNRKNQLSTTFRDSWSPLREVAKLHQGIDQMFEDFFTPISTRMMGDQPMMTLVPQCEIRENEGSYQMDFELPGVPKENVKIELNENQLVVTGEKKSEKKDEQTEERYHGVFQRSFSLPSNVDPDQIEARYENGVLSLTVPKTEQRKSRMIPIGEQRNIERKQSKGSDQVA